MTTMGGNNDNRGPCVAAGACVSYGVWGTGVLSVGMCFAICGCVACVQGTGTVWFVMNSVYVGTCMWSVLCGVSRGIQHVFVVSCLQAYVHVMGVHNMCSCMCDACAASHVWCHVCSICCCVVHHVAQQVGCFMGVVMWCHACGV